MDKQVPRVYFFKISFQNQRSKITEDNFEIILL